MEEILLMRWPWELKPGIGQLVNLFYYYRILDHLDLNERNFSFTFRFGFFCLFGWLVLFFLRNHGLILSDILTSNKHQLPLVHHRLTDMHTWSSADGTVWEWLEGVILLEEVCDWEWDLRFQKTCTISSVLSASCLQVKRCAESYLFAQLWLTLTL